MDTLRENDNGGRGSLSQWAIRTAASGPLLVGPWPLTAPPQWRREKKKAPAIASHAWPVWGLGCPLTGSAQAQARSPGPRHTVATACTCSIWGQVAGLQWQLPPTWYSTRAALWHVPGNAGNTNSDFGAPSWSFSHDPELLRSPLYVGIIMANIVVVGVCIWVVSHPFPHGTPVYQIYFDFVLFFSSLFFCFFSYLPIWFPNLFSFPSILDICSSALLFCASICFSSVLNLVTKTVVNSLIIMEVAEDSQLPCAELVFTLESFENVAASGTERLQSDSRIILLWLCF